MLLDDVKVSLRVTNTSLDIEISDLIAAARLDLIQSGISSDKANMDTDPLIRRAIITYCKANFGYDNPEANRFSESYNMLKIHLALAGDYMEAVDETP
jgi:uncharacterized phage protein (predicted DNA packaging)